MKKILAFSSGLFLILALFQMNSNVTVSAKSADVQSAEESVTDVTEENWHVDGMEIENDSAPVAQEEQTMDVIATTQNVNEATTETVDGTADSVNPTIEATTTELNSQNEEKNADDIIPSVAAPETETEDVTDEIIKEEDTPNVGVKEQETEKKAVEVKGATVFAKGTVDSITSSGETTEETQNKSVVKIEEEQEVPGAAVLPQTGVVPASCFYGLGFLICALGICTFTIAYKREDK